MIQASITKVIPGTEGRDAKAYARSQTLVSPENQRGEVMFYVAPPFWTAGRDPHPGQRIVIGSIERKLRPGWSRPGWLARDVSPAFAVEHYARHRARSAHAHRPSPSTRRNMGPTPGRDRL